MTFFRRRIPSLNDAAAYGLIAGGLLAEWLLAAVAQFHFGMR